RHTLRPEEAKGVEMTVRRRGRRAQVTVDAIDPSGRYLSDAAGTLAVFRQGEGRKVPLEQTAPGRYVAEFDAAQEGEYILHVALARGGQMLPPLTRGLVVGYPDELRVRPTDEALLRALSADTGGVFGPDPAEVFTPGGPGAPRRDPLW